MRIAAVRATLLQKRVLWARPVEKIVTVAPPRDRKTPAPSTPLAEGLVLTLQEAKYSAFEGEPVPVEEYLMVSDAPGFGLTLQPEALDRLRGEL